MINRRWDDLASKLYDIAEQLRDLSPSHFDPERFHMDKDELVKAILSLADDVA